MFDSTTRRRHCHDQNNEIIVRNDASPQGLNTRFDPDKETIFWSPVWGLDIKLDANDPANDEGKAIAGNQSPAIGLFNEVAGAYVSLYFNKEKKRELGIEKLKDEEEWHIDQENKAIDVLNSRGFNETKRFDENCTGCMPRKMTGPTSTQTNKDSTND
jgi:hypothetical protein